MRLGNEWLRRGGITGRGRGMWNFMLLTPVWFFLEGARLLPQRAPTHGREIRELEGVGGCMKRALAVPHFAAPLSCRLMWKQERRVQRASQRDSKGAGLWISDGGANPLKISRFRQLFLWACVCGGVLECVGVCVGVLVPFCILSMADEPRLRARLLSPDCTSPRRVHRLFEGLYFPQTVSFSMLWCGNRRAAMCRDTGTLLSQTAAGMSVNLSASHLCYISAHCPPPSFHRHHPPPTTEN